MVDLDHLAAILGRLAFLHVSGVRLEVTKVISGGLVKEFLRARGWSQVPHANHALVVYQHPDHKFADGDPLEIVLVVDDALQGARIQLDIALNLLAATYDKPASDVVAEMLDLPPGYFTKGWLDDITTLATWVAGSIQV